MPASVHVGIDYTVHTHVRIETRYCVWFGNTFRPMQLCCKHLTTWIDVEKINGPNVIFSISRKKKTKANTEKRQQQEQKDYTWTSRSALSSGVRTTTDLVVGTTST